VAAFSEGTHARMQPTTFELSLTLPCDPRFAGTARDVAVHAAKHAGCTESDAEAFGRDVEGTVRRCLERGPADESLPIVVRCADAVEVLVDGHTLTVKA